MKKAVLIALGMGMSVASFAQRSAIQSAENYLKNDNDYEHAIEYINKATADASTKDDPKTWSVKGKIYMTMQQDPKYKAENPYREAANSYMKVISLKPDYNKEEVTANLLACAYNYFNDAIGEYNKHNFDTSAAFMLKVVDIHDIDGGKIYAGNKGFDTVAATAKYVAANSYYFNNKFDQALPIYQSIKDSKLIDHSDIYEYLADIYNRQGKTDEFLAVVTEGEKRYPNDKMLRNDEINYYIKANKQTELINKLEDATNQDPKNAELVSILAQTYSSMASPRDASGKDMPPPANADELEKKAIDAYEKAIALDPNNAVYDFNLGALYVNKASDYGAKMNAITGTSDADNKKYNALKVQRDANFKLAIQYLEKADALWEPKLNTLTPDDLASYKNSLTSLQQIYSINNKMDKVAEVKKKLEAVRSK